MDYYAKYLKYKTKYLELKNKLEGGVCNKKCDKDSYCLNIGKGKEICNKKNDIDHGCIIKLKGIDCKSGKCRLTVGGPYPICY